ncbi:MAG: hypothetical protein ACHQFZ_02240 [Acidimicrobiales bacterium]
MLLGGCVSAPTQLTFPGADVAGSGADPGTPLSISLIIQPKPDASITLISLKLIPLPGFRLPRLLGAVILKRKRGYPLYVSGYPPPHVSFGMTLPTRRFGGVISDVHLVRYEQPPVLLYGIVAGGSGMYADAGVMLTYRYHGVIQSAPIYDGAILFYSPGNLRGEAEKRSQAEFRKKSQEVTAAFSKYLDRVRG